MTSKQENWSKKSVWQFPATPETSTDEDLGNRNLCLCMCDWKIELEASQVSRITQLCMSRFYKWSLGILQGKYFFIGKASAGLVCFLVSFHTYFSTCKQTIKIVGKNNNKARICIHNNLRLCSTRKHEKETRVTTPSGSKLVPLLCFKHVPYEEGKAEDWSVTQRSPSNSARCLVRAKGFYAEHHSNASQDTGWYPCMLRATGHFATGFSKARLCSWSLSELL